MLEKKIVNLLRRLLPADRYLFRTINSRLKLGLDYSINRDAVRILESIFIRREYADGFPFYQPATIIDIGAHYGYFSLFAHLNAAKDTRIFALEPSASNFEVLTRNLTAAGAENVQAIRAAVSAESGPTQLFRSHSFNHSLFPSAQEATPEEVPGLRLEEILQQYDLPVVDFLKIDCEGAEYPILLNAPPAVLARIRVLSLEFHDLRQEGFAPDQLAGHLKNNGFEIIKFTYDPDYSISNLNFGKMVAVRPRK